MKNILNELIEDIISLNEKNNTTKKSVVPAGLFAGSYGKYYSDKELTKYAGKVVGSDAEQKWIPASQEPDTPKQPTQASSTPTSDKQKSPSQAQQPQEQPPIIQPVTDTSPKALSVKAGGLGDTRPNDVMGNLFATGSEIEIQGKKVAIRHMINPNTGQTLNMAKKEDRIVAVELLDIHLNQFKDNGKIKEVCDALADPELPTPDRTRLRKWIGTLGEIGGLRDMLAAGIESYLYEDSNPKNDIAAVVDCGKNEESTDIQLVGVSTKSTAGKSNGRIDASALGYVVDSVAGKMIPLTDKKGNKRPFLAENIATCLFSMQKRMYSTLTRGAITRGPRFGGSERMISVPDEDKDKYDEQELAKAKKLQQSAKSQKDSGGQRELVHARKVSVDDINNIFRDPSSKSYDILLKTMTRIMGGEDRASTLIGLLSWKLRNDVEKNPDFRLDDFDKWMTNEIANLIDSPHQETGEPSSLVFQSDMMFARFSADGGYEGISMVTGDTMTERVNEKWPEYQNMSTTDKLKNVLGWKMNPRGMGMESKEGGYIDPQQRAVPPVKLLKRTDYKSIKQFIQDICKKNT